MSTNQCIQCVAPLTQVDVLCGRAQCRSCVRKKERDEFMLEKEKDREMERIMSKIIQPIRPIKQFYCASCNILMNSDRFTCSESCERKFDIDQKERLRSDKIKYDNTPQGRTLMMADICEVMYQAERKKSRAIHKTTVMPGTERSRLFGYEPTEPNQNEEK